MTKNTKKLFSPHNPPWGRPPETMQRQLENRQVSSSSSNLGARDQKSLSAENQRVARGHTPQCNSHNHAPEALKASGLVPPPCSQQSPMNPETHQSLGIRPCAPPGVNSSPGSVYVHPTRSGEGHKGQT